MRSAGAGAVGCGARETSLFEYVLAREDVTAGSGAGVTGGLSLQLRLEVDETRSL